MDRQSTARILLASLLVLSGCSEIAPTPAIPTDDLATPTEFVPTPKPLPTEVITATVTPETTTNAPAAGSPGIGDSLYPNLGNGGYDVQHYTLDITVNDVATGDLNGIVTIDALATQNLESFNLDFIGFEIMSIKVNGQDADFTRADNELTITPSEPLLSGESFTVETIYAGSPEQIVSAAIPFQVGWALADGESYVWSEPDGAANFFPVNDHPLDKATFTFRVTVPKPFDVVANGNLTETTESGDMTVYVWEADDPMASYLATINISDYDLEVMDGPNGITIRNYYAADLPDDANKIFAKQGEMIEFFSETFGPYPFDVYGSLVLKTEKGGALENQTISVFGADILNPSIEPAERVVAHELAHQWFGDAVSVADWSDIWLNESFASYAEALWVEHTGGRSALDAWVKEAYSFASRSYKRWPPPGNPSADLLFNGNIYNWGSLTLHALRVKVGDEAFFNILKTYYARYQGGNASTADFIAVAEEVSGLDLEAFFNDWLYSTKLPPMPVLEQ